jgi:aminopeptidase N
MAITETRNAFPCFDEPAMKSKFKLTVIHNKYLKAISNMPVNNTVELYVFTINLIRFIKFIFF